MSYNGTTHPEILETERKGFIGREKVSSSDNTYQCYICQNDYTCAYTHKVGGEEICPSCIGLSRSELLFLLVEEKQQHKQTIEGTRRLLK